MKTHQIYQIGINLLIDQINDIAKEGTYFKANFNAKYGGWRLEQYYKATNKQKISVLRNEDRLDSKSFLYYIDAILTTMLNVNNLTKPF